MTIIKSNSNKVFTSNQQPLLCNDVATNQSSQLMVLGQLVASTATVPLYYTGTLLAVYGANAPSPDLVGWYVNYDPASSNADQAVCVGAVAGEFVSGVTGATLTNPTTVGQTYNAVNVIKFTIGTTYYRNVLVANNTTAAMTGFDNTFNVVELADIYYNNIPTTVESIQGVK